MSEPQQAAGAQPSPYSSPNLYQRASRKAPVESTCWALVLDGVVAWLVVAVALVLAASGGGR